MLGLGEQVKGLDGGGGIPGLVEFRQIPYLGGWVAGNVTMKGKLSYVPC